MRNFSLKFGQVHRTSASAYCFSKCHVTSSIHWFNCQSMYWSWVKWTSFGSGKRSENTQLFVFCVPCLHCVPSHEVILGALVSVPHGDVKLLALVLVQIQLKLLLPLGIQTLIYSFGFVPLIRQSVKIPPSSPKI